MPSSLPPPVSDPGGVVQLRPRSAVWISIIVWGLVGVLFAEALYRSGSQALVAVPLGVLISVGVWAVLWAPRVVLHEQHLEIRNIVVTHVVPFTALTRVRVGSMLRVHAWAPDGKERVLTAWNAPTLRKERLPSARELNEAKREGLKVASRQEMLIADQAACPSYVITLRWNQWADHNDAESSDSAEAGSGAATYRTHPNVISIVLISATVLLCVIQLLQ